MEQESASDDQDPNISILQNIEYGTEGSKITEENGGTSQLPKHLFGTDNAATLEDVEQNPSITETEECDQGGEGAGGADKESLCPTEQFNSQTNSDSDKGLDDDNNVVGASAESLYTTKTCGKGGKQVMFSCNVCEKEFKVKRDCLRHIRVHTREKPFKCYDCGEFFGREDYLRRHLNTHSGEKPFACSVCNKYFARKATLEQHLLTHTDKSERPFPCYLCEKAFIKKSHLQRHFKTHIEESTNSNEQNLNNSTNEGSDPGLDGSINDNEDPVVEHDPVISETGEGEQGLESSLEGADKELSCQPEDFLSQTISILDEDLDKNHAEGVSIEACDTDREQGMHGCNVCKKYFKDKRTLNRHAWVHTEEKPFECYNCEKTFRREDYLTKHQKRCGKRKYSCRICKRVFARKNTKDVHMCLHNDKSKKPFPCNQCKKGFSKKSHLEIHLQICHNQESAKDDQNTNITTIEDSDHELENHNATEERDKSVDVSNVAGASAESLYTLTHTYETGRKRVRYWCNVCRKKFKDRRACTRHVRSHSGEKPFKCYDCGVCFGREDYLRRHIKTHSGEKPFSCLICNNNFAVKSTLDQHLLTHIDISERPFPCNQCEKSFVKRSHLDRHLKIHSPIREFACTKCGKGFIEKGHLLDHTKRIHSDRVLPSCKICNRKFRWEHLLKLHMKAETCTKAIDEFEKQLLDHLPIFISKDKNKTETNTNNSQPVKLLENNLPIFVSRDKKEVQTNKQKHPSTNILENTVPIFVSRDKKEVKTNTQKPSSTNILESTVPIFCQ